MYDRFVVSKYEENVWEYQNAPIIVKYCDEYLRWDKV